MEEDTAWVYAGAGALFALLVPGLARFRGVAAPSPSIPVVRIAVANVDYSTLTDTGAHSIGFLSMGNKVGKLNSVGATGTICWGVNIHMHTTQNTPYPTPVSIGMVIRDLTAQPTVTAAQADTAFANAFPLVTPLVNSPVVAGDYYNNDVVHYLTGDRQPAIATLGTQSGNYIADDYGNNLAVGDQMALDLLLKLTVNKASMAGTTFDASIIASLLTHNY